MATQEKLHKSLEILKSLSNQQLPDHQTKKKEKIHHIYVVSEIFSNAAIRVSPNFSILLGVTTETFLHLCNDQNSDVRMTSDECLNRVIRAVNSDHMSRIQLVLFQEIDRNLAARSVRAAFIRFSQLADHIRPHKGKPYVTKLFPAIIRLTERTEESIHETLLNYLPNILNRLGIFASDNQLKNLLNSFLKNITKSSAMIRRTSSSCIVSICTNSRRPQFLLNFSINYLIDSIRPVNIISENNNWIVLGVLQCFKVLLAIVKEIAKETEIPHVSSSNFLQIYEICIYCLNSKDHNVVNLSLDTLSTLLNNSTKELQQLLLNPNGIDRSKIHKSLSQGNVRSPSQLSVATNSMLTEEHLFDETELTVSIQTDIEKWIGESQLTVENLQISEAKNEYLTESVESSSVEIPYYIESSHLKSTESLNNINNNTRSSSADNLEILSDKLSEESEEIERPAKENEIIDLDIGDFLDKSVPLQYCLRLITKSFLLTGISGKYLMDKISRVSVKASALSCLTSIFQLYPEGFFTYLDQNYILENSEANSKISSQKIDEILLLANHSDPQIRGIIRNLISSIIIAVLNKTKMNYSLWSKMLDDYSSSTKIIYSNSSYNIKEFIRIFQEGLLDQNSTCLRQTLIALNNCLNLLAHSNYGREIIPILEILPCLPENTYWLVKVSLCELVSNISYISIYHLTGNSIFQQKVLYNILLEFLKDSDQRIRSAAATALTEILPLIYSEEFNFKRNLLTIKALINGYLYSKRNNFEHENMLFPFSQLSNQPLEEINFFLPKIISKLYASILETQSKYFIYGCIEALSLLSEKYSCIVYRSGWGIPKNNAKNLNTNGNIKDILGLCLNLLSTSIHSYDINFLNNLMRLTSNLYAGYAAALVKLIDVTDKTLKSWSMFSNESMRFYSQQFLLHSLRLLNIFHCVISDIPLVNIHNKMGIPHFSSTSSLSPIKKRKSDERKLSLKADKEEKHVRKEIKANGLGYFSNSPHYMRIYEILKSAFINYKISLDGSSSEIFIDLMRKTLYSLNCIMEIGTIREFGNIAEEILGYLKSTFQLNKTLTIQSVQQLLKCLFETNLTSNLNEFQMVMEYEKNNENGDFYCKIFQRPSEDLALFIASLSKITSKIECNNDYTVMDYIHRKNIRKTSILRNLVDENLINYIKIFEQIVINSLKQYTVTNDIEFQSYVLKLLSQLVQLKINYCLVDPDQVFKNFVLKQFEYIEEGLIQNCEILITDIFQFLINLSYSNQHSKSLIDIPKIIQLCDGLMASGQDLQTYCIPAIKPIVKEVFLIRNRTNCPDVKELETTREVLLAMLLRLLEYTEIIDLISVILEDSKYCTDDTDKWFRWSELVINAFLNLLGQDKIRIDDAKSFSSMKRFISALNPNVFKSIDEELIMVFQALPSDNNNQPLLSRWLSKILLLFFITSTLKENDLLKRINAIKAQFNPNSIFENYVATADPLNVYNNAEAFEGIDAEIIIVKFIFRVILLISKKMESLGTNVDEFLIQQFSLFLVYCRYTFANKSFSNISKGAVILLDEYCVHINKYFISLMRIYPLLVLQWCNLLSILKYNSIDFWNLLKSNRKSINDDLLEVGGVILLCDYLNENISETKLLQYVLSEHTEQLIDLIDENIVSKFIFFIHQNSTLSKLFITTIMKKCVGNLDLIFKINLLKAVENSHSSQTGAVIKLLIPNLLQNRENAISRMVSNLACRKIEYLFTMPIEEILSQFSREDLFIIKGQFDSKRIAKKYETLMSLFNKLLVQYYNNSASVIINVTENRVNSEHLRKLEIDRKWLISQIENKYDDGRLKNETAKILEMLEFDELICLISSDGFNKVILKHCIENGVKMLEKLNLQEEPAILKAAIDGVLNDIRKIVSEEVIQIKDWALLQSVASSVASLTKYLSRLPTLQLSEIDCENISKFSVIALKHCEINLDLDKQNFNVQIVESLLNCANEILKNPQFSSYLNMELNCAWFCSAVNSIYLLTNFLLRNDDEPLPSIENFYQLKNNLEINTAQKSCYYLYTLTLWLYRKQNYSDKKIPIFLLFRIKSLIISLARLPLGNSLCLVPYRVWKLGWEPEFDGKLLTQVPSSLPADLLNEIDVLEEYIFRITTLGWISRQQFEETWMCFLGVLCTPLDNLSDSGDISNAQKASALAIKAITALLLQTLRYPILGNKNTSKIIHVSRNAPLPSAKCIGTRKLKDIQMEIEEKYVEIYQKDDINNVFACRNFEKINNEYSYGQISIRYFLISTNSLEGNWGNFTELIYEKRKKQLEESGLDVNSCLRFLQEFYTQLLKPESVISDIRILHETVRSTLHISDLFTEKSQFSWMLEFFSNLLKTHSAEDELLHQYLIVGICKAVGVLTPDIEVYEQTKKMLVQFLKSPFLPTRISCLYGLLYILEGSFLANIVIGGISETIQLILPCICEYVQNNLNTNNSVLKQSQEHTMLLWSLAFFLMENIDDIHMEANFITNTLQSALNLVQENRNNVVSKSIIKALERLLIIKPMYILEKIGRNLLKLSLDLLHDENSAKLLLGIQFLVTYMYVDCWEHLEKPIGENEQCSPDHLVQTVEKISAIFERIKKSYVKEVKLLCSILPAILKDFFSPSDILTKIIAEFLSPQQTHPEFMSEVIFQVFNNAIQQNQLLLLQDWIVINLPNFIQSLSNMSIWSLTCFFICASSNKWLKAYFPYMQSRVGRYEDEDRKIFCITGKDFYRNLSSDQQRKAFVDSFVKVKNHVDMPFNDLLGFI